MDIPTALAGFTLSLSLILAIGAQNAFVLRQGILGRHVGPVVAVCCVSEVVLISVGVSSFTTLSRVLPWLVPAFQIGGAAFLLIYGLQSFRSAWRGGAALEPGAEASSLRAALLTVLAMTYLNPHCYLDTVVLIGSVSTQYAAPWAFGLGAMAASILFFLILGYGARVLRPVFARPRAWQGLEALMGVVMWGLAAKLLLL